MAEEQEQQLDEELDLGIEKGGNKKLIIMIAAGVLLLALIGGGVWFFLSGDDEAPAEGEEAAAEETAEQSEEAAEEAELLPPIYHPLKPVFVVNLPPGGDAKMLQIGVNVMLRQPELQEFLKHNDPMVRDRLLSVFSIQESSNLRSRAGKEKLQTEVQKELEKIVEELGGSGKIESVYFTSFVMQ